MKLFVAASSDKQDQAISTNPFNILQSPLGPFLRMNIANGLICCYWRKAEVSRRRNEHCINKLELFS